MILFTEELALNAWPALQTLAYDGWLLRFAEGYTKRANSVNPLYGSTIPTLEKINYCEEIYTAQGLDTVFKLTSATRPENLDDILSERGYQKKDLTSVQTLDLANLVVPSEFGGTVEATPQLTEEWLENFCRLNRVDEKYTPTMKRMLESIIPQRCFMALKQEGETVATGLAVLERGYVGLFDIVTASHLRKQGLGRQLILHLLNWARIHGAHHAYLQVVYENAPARRLYEKLGFQEIYTYWYRIKPNSL